VLTLIELLVPEGNRTDSVSAAAIYHQLERRPRTVLLVDEADGLDLLRSHALRSVFNRLVASVPNLCAPRDCGDRHAAPAIAASFNRNQHAAIRCSMNSPGRNRALAAQAGTGLRARNARKGASVDRSRACVAWFCA
jgi:hypothetical protein